MNYLYPGAATFKGIIMFGMYDVIYHINHIPMGRDLDLSWSFAMAVIGMILTVAAAVVSVIQMINNHLTKQDQNQVTSEPEPEPAISIQLS